MAMLKFSMASAGSVHTGVKIAHKHAEIFIQLALCFLVAMVSNTIEDFSRTRYTCKYGDLPFRYLQGNIP